MEVAKAIAAGFSFEDMNTTIHDLIHYYLDQNR